jgi:hypothetical protein
VTLKEIQSPNGELKAVLAARTCGTTRGFIVSIVPTHEAGNVHEDVFMMRTGGDVDVDLPAYASMFDLEWNGNDRLVVATAPNLGTVGSPQGEQRFRSNVKVEVRQRTAG